MAPVQKPAESLADIKRMKTNTETAATTPPPGNVSTRQLAATLTKTAPATGQSDTPTETAEAGPAATTREASPAKGEEKAEAAVDQTESTAKTAESTETTEKTETAASTETAEAVETTEGNESHEGGETTETTETQERGGGAAATELPPEVAEAIEIAKAQDGGKGKAQLLQRVHKLVDERDTERNARLAAEEKVTRMTTELDDARKGKAQPAAPTGDLHPAVAEVVGEIRNVDQWLGTLRKAQPALNNGTQSELQIPDGKGGMTSLSADQVNNLVDDLTNQRTELVARKVQTEGAVKQAFRETYRQVHAQAVREYPWLDKTDSPQTVRMQEMLKAIPSLKQYPDYELVMGDYFAGQAARLARQKAARMTPATKVPVKTPEPPRVPIAGGAGGGTGEKPGDGDATEADKQFEKTGKVGDLAKSFSAKARATRVTKK